MKLQLILFALLMAGWSAAQAAPDSTNSVSTNRVLMIEPSSMSIATGKVTLTVGPLDRVNGVFTGYYRIKVSPYFFKNEKGKLAITVPDEVLAKINRGEEVAIVGTATTIGKTGRSRRIEATATPTDINCGTLRLWFMAGDKKMIFEPAYHFSEAITPAVATQPAKTNVAANSQPAPPDSPHEGAQP
jgi:hypothetical protein